MLLFALLDEKINQSHFMPYFIMTANKATNLEDHTEIGYRLLGEVQGRDEFNY